MERTDGDSERSAGFWKRDVVYHVVPEKGMAGDPVPAEEMRGGRGGGCEGDGLACAATHTPTQSRARAQGLALPKNRTEHHVGMAASGS